MILKNHPGHSINTWTGEVARLEAGKTIRTFCARSGEQGLRPTGRKRNRLSICCQPVSPNSCWGLFFFFTFLFISDCARSSRLHTGFLELQQAGFSLKQLLLLRSMGSRPWTQQMQLTGLGAPWHGASSQSRDRTLVPCTGRWILNHWTTREVPGEFSKIQTQSMSAPPL